MKKIYVITLTIVIILIVSIVAFIFYLHSSGQIQFIPDKFAEEFWKFLANLGSIVFGFILINVYWAGKEQRDKINQGKSALLNYLLRINRVSSKIIELLSLVFSEDEYLMANQERDEEIASLIGKMEKLMNGLESSAIDPLVLSDAIGKKVYIEIVGEELIPAIEATSKIKNFREKYKEFEELIQRIMKSSGDGIGYLTGLKKLEA